MIILCDGFILIQFLTNIKIISSSCKVLLQGGHKKTVKTMSLLLGLISILEDFRCAKYAKATLKIKILKIQYYFAYIYAAKIRTFVEFVP